ncbi:MAG: autotransporter assembly complex protein TamA, partial [Rhodospirillaceae bacterium]
MHRIRSLICAASHTGPLDIPKRFYRLCAWGGVIGLFFGFNAIAQAQTTPNRDEDPAAQERALVYKTDLKLPEDTPDDMAEALESASRLIALEDQPPFSRLGLTRRAQEDEDRLSRVMRSEGYYASAVSHSVQLAANPDEPATVDLSVEPGPQYRLGQVDIRYVSRNGVQSLPNGAAALGLQQGDPAQAKTILAAIDSLVSELKNTGRPLAQITDQRIAVDHRDRSMTVVLTVDPGPFARFGALRVEGLEDVEADHVLAMVPWQPGDPYDASKVSEYRKTLSETRLFESIRTERPTEVKPDGSLPVAVEVDEGPPRTIGLGARYGTQLGPEGLARWQHRNLFGRGEVLTGEVHAGLLRQSLSGDFRKPLFFGIDQALTIGAEASRETYETYSALTAESALAVERKFWENWTASAGLAWELTQLWDHDEFGNVKVALSGVPLSVSRDDTDDVLDPSEGTRFSVTVTPWGGIVGDRDTGFVEASTRLSGYLEALEDKRLILAAWTEAAGVLGAPYAYVTPNHRLYAGG